MTAVLTSSNHVTVERLWHGETAVVIGGGPSLTPEDVNYCRGKARVIAIKEAHELAPWADAVYACDEHWWRFHKGLPSFAGLKFGLEPAPLYLTQYEDWEVQLLRNTGMDGLELEPSGLRTGQNSGYQAIGLAVHLGVSRIVLLGFDMWTAEDGRQNWFQGHAGRRPYHQPTPYPVFHHFFQTIAEPLQAAGVEVINCSRFSMLRVFPMRPLEEVLV